MIYILGVNEHRYQAVNPKINPDEREFHNFVLKQVRAKDIHHLAEEMNDECLQRENGAQESVCRKLAIALGITHTMCEPNALEKKQLGYEDKSWVEFVRKDETGCNEIINAAFSEFHKKQWHLREVFWFRKLQPHLINNVLFVCGANHVDRFSELLKGKGVKNHVIRTRWKPSMR